GLGRAQDAVGAAYAVVEVFVALAHQKVACLALVVDDRGNHVADLLYQVRLAAPQRDLIRDLVEVPHRLGAFAVQSADGQADFLQRTEELVDLPRDHQGRQVQHHAHAHASADVRGAGREIAELFVEGVGDLFFHQIVDAVDRFPGVCQIQA